MCGIAGYWVTTGSRPANEKTLRRMLGSIAHRGPDADGCYLDGSLGLAHARLSIIDLAGGAQPMSNEDGSIWITFNGEIFNYRELREEVRRRGHHLASSSDTEVILHLFEDEGENCVRHLNGQWALAIWDRNRQRLFLSRDRLGVRPLFYTFAGDQFVFGSEVKAILAHPDVSRSVDLDTLNQVFSYWHPLPSRTMFRNISELPPGHSAFVQGGALQLMPYWCPDYETTPVPNEDAAAEELLSLLEDATRLRLRSDVPVGAYLSGGLDSTVTTALIRRVSNTHLRTFSVSFTESSFDESGYQQEAVRHLGTEHSELRCETADIGRVFPEVIWHTEVPLLRTAPAPLYLLSRLVRQSGFKVVMTGEGADEMLGGYDIFKEAKVRRFCAQRPESQHRPKLLRRLYPYIPGMGSQPAAYLSSFFRFGEQDLASPFFSHLPRWQLAASLFSLFTADVKAQLAPPNGHSAVAAGLPPGFASWNWMAKAQYLESTLLMPQYILSSQGDRVAMAHAVEGRFPFLDYRVAEFANRLPAQLKLKVLNEKYLLKRATGNLVPPSIAKRHKQPYRAPEAASFFATRFDYVEELLSSEKVRSSGIFRPEPVRNLVARAKSGQLTSVRDNMALVGVLSTQIWLDRFIDRFGGAR